MLFYKIIQDQNVVGIGCTFLKWHPNKRSFFYCDADSAECVQDIITEKLYHPDWLSKPPEEASASTDATVTVIDENEYNELFALLEDGETVPEPEPPEIIPDEPDPDQDAGANERPMSVQEMRTKIAEMEEMLNIIMGVSE